MLEYFKNIWSGISTSWMGMAITWKHLFLKKVTIQYPDERFPLPENARNRLKLDMSHCNGCTSCAIICPVKCIKIETIRAVPDDPHKDYYWDGKERKMWLARYEIDFAKCCFCGLCTEVCPTDAINHTVEYEYSVYHRESLLYKFQTLTPAEVEEKRRLLDEFRMKESRIAEAKASEQKDKEKRTDNGTI